MNLKITLLLLSSLLFTQAHLQFPTELLILNQSSIHHPISHTLNLTPPEIELILKGVLQGIEAKTQYSDIETCIQYTESIGKDIFQAVEDFKTETATGMKDGIQLIASAIQLLPQAIAECKGAEGDVINIEKMLEEFEHPITLVYHVAKSLIVNGVEILQYIEGAVKSYESQQYEQFGIYIGEALYDLVFSETQQIGQLYLDFLNKTAPFETNISPKFANLTRSEMKQYLGTRIVNLNEYNVPRINRANETHEFSVPINWTSNEQWPDCAHPIQNQGKCGSCWAFGASETVSDRFCIASNGSINKVMSPQYLVSCNNLLNHGCSGGILYFAWLFMEYNGIPSLDCLPYTSENGTSGSCPSGCVDGEEMTKYKIQGDSVHTFSNPQSIQLDMLQDGPVETAFSVYEDFITYSGGIYEHTSGSWLGGHAVKMIGWGVSEEGVNYWVVQNSWGSDWGEQGYFRIKWGECGIDSDAIAGLPKL